MIPLLLLALILGIVRIQSSQWRIERHVRTHPSELEALVNGTEQEYHGWHVRRIRLGAEKARCVVVSVSSFGLAPSGRERGFLWLEADPETLEVDGINFTSTDDGWTWCEARGDNGGTLVPIVNMWYYFEWHW